jgi:hypothetical protein
MLLPLATETLCHLVQCAGFQNSSQVFGRLIKHDTCGGLPSPVRPWLHSWLVTRMAYCMIPQVYENPGKYSMWLPKDCDLA